MSSRAAAIKFDVARMPLWADHAAFERNVRDYEAGKMRLGTDSVIPHRLKYKKFKR